ncbi:sugar transferase [Winogradskya consettensis]|uniref:Sugar transferase n=1 Tax=Winogradskya consettensis TaxID=113560 RepID=A0A919VNJ4_9ACTN|nr:sugar transferase [Actinoplanes consettensis]GIM70152.1 sugar transferase [Actinoplanes consettensis]
MTYDSRKRLLDVSAAVLGLLLTLPLMLILALTVALTLGRPVLFRQHRAGRHGTTFTLLKFRTMVDEDPARGLATDAERLTGWGRFLRSTSLDELPSLVNVLRGEMSLVGPRPLPVRYLDRYTPDQARRHEVLPGITGLAQVRGRNLLTWEEKFHYDVAYVGARSLSLDLRLLAATALAVIRRDGISAHDEATAPEFKGSPV